MMAKIAPTGATAPKARMPEGPKARREKPEGRKIEEAQPPIAAKPKLIRGEGPNRCVALVRREAVSELCEELQNVHVIKQHALTGSKGEPRLRFAYMEYPQYAANKVREG